MPSIKYFSSRGGWPWANDVSVPRKVTPGPPGWNFFVQCPGLISWPCVDLARLLRRAYSRSVWIISFEFVKVCGIRFSIWESFNCFYILLLSYFYDPGMFIFRWSSNFVEKVVLNESMSAKMAPRVSYLVYYYCR